jgi:hypothetical protein
VLAFRISYFFDVVYFPLEHSSRLLIDSKDSHELLDSEIERKDRGNNARHFAHTKLLKSVTSCANNQVRWKTNYFLKVLSSEMDLAVIRLIR